MMQTIEAIIDENGKIHFLENVKLEPARRVLVTILKPTNENESSLNGGLDDLGEILDDDLEAASHEIAESFKNALEHSARELEN